MILLLIFLMPLGVYLLCQLSYSTTVFEISDGNRENTLIFGIVTGAF